MLHATLYLFSPVIHYSSNVSHWTHINDGCILKNPSQPSLPSCRMKMNALLLIFFSTYVSVCAQLSRWKAKNETRKRIHRKTTQEHPHIDIDNDNNITSWVKLFQCSDRVHVSCALLYSNFIYAIKKLHLCIFLVPLASHVVLFHSSHSGGCFFRCLLSLDFFPFGMCVCLF